MIEITKIMGDIFRKNGQDFNIMGKFIKSIIVICMVYIAIKVFNKLINRFLERKKDTKFGMDERKVNTLASILKNVVKYIFYFFAAVTILDLFGIETSSLIATAGIGGLAIGFAAQNLVKDVIVGFFILLEEQFNIGDYIQIGEYEGIVEELGMRTTKIRDFSGELHIIPNSNIEIVTNKTAGAMRALVEVNIPNSEDTNKIIRMLEDVCKDIKQSSESIIEGPNVLGISNLGEYNTTLTIIAKTQPMEQWAVERKLRKEIKAAFQNEGIQQPYPKVMIMKNEDLEGDDDGRKI